jgi:hypothetical protein
LLSSCIIPDLLKNDEPKELGKKYYDWDENLTPMCIGGGMGMAAIWER